MATADLPYRTFRPRRSAALRINVTESEYERIVVAASQTKECLSLSATCRDLMLSELARRERAQAKRK